MTLRFHITSEIWPQPNVVALHQPVHGFFHEGHIARVFHILDAGEAEGGEEKVV